MDEEDKKLLKRIKNLVHNELIETLNQEDNEDIFLSLEEICDKMLFLIGERESI